MHFSCDVQPYNSTTSSSNHKFTDYSVMIFTILSWLIDSNFVDLWHLKLSHFINATEIPALWFFT